MEQEIEVTLTVSLDAEIDKAAVESVFRRLIDLNNRSQDSFDMHLARVQVREEAEIYCSDEKTSSEEQEEQIILDTLAYIKSQTGLDLKRCPHFNTLSENNRGQYFSVLLNGRATPGNPEYSALEKLPGIVVKSNGVNRVAIFPFMWLFLLAGEEDISAFGEERFEDVSQLFSKKFDTQAARNAFIEGMYFVLQNGTYSIISAEEQVKIK